MEETHKFKINEKYKNVLRSVIVPVINGLADLSLHYVTAFIKQTLMVALSMHREQLTTDVQQQLKTRFGERYNTPATRQSINQQIDTLLTQAIGIRNDALDPNVLHWNP